MNKWTRTDKCQTEIDKELRAVGATVVPLGNVGKGVPDRLVGWRGQMWLMEIKNPERMATRGPAERANHGRTPAQVKFHTEWQGPPIIIAYTPQEALKAIGAIA